MLVYIYSTRLYRPNCLSAMFGKIASLVSAMFQPFPRYVLHTPHTTLLSNTLTSSDPSTTLPQSRGLIIHALATSWARYSIQVFHPRNCGSNLQIVTKWINMHNTPHPTRQKACFAPFCWFLRMFCGSFFFRLDRQNRITWHGKLAWLDPKYFPGIWQSGCVPQAQHPNYTQLAPVNQGFCLWSLLDMSSIGSKVKHHPSRQNSFLSGSFEHFRPTCLICNVVGIYGYFNKNIAARQNCLK